MNIFVHALIWVFDNFIPNRTVYNWSQSEDYVSNKKSAEHNKISI
jgi:hypothetical protein